MLEYVIIPGCVHDLIPGTRFLRQIEALTKFVKTRVKVLFGLSTAIGIHPKDSN